jgi:hypothetical protein
MHVQVSDNHEPGRMKKPHYQLTPRQIVNEFPLSSVILLFTSYSAVT